MPGDCSPSRSVVSKMWTRFASDTSGLIGLASFCLLFR
jgi:hypothetical protein